MAFAKFEGNRCRIDGEIAENHAILVNLTASIATCQNKRHVSMTRMQRKTHLALKCIEAYILV